MRVNEYPNEEIIRQITGRIKKLSSLRVPNYDLPGDSFIDKCSQDILDIIDNDKWIKCSEQMPDKSGSYVCFMKSDHDEYGIYTGIFRISSFAKLHKDSIGAFYSKCENITEDVKYWLELPPFPKDEK